MNKLKFIIFLLLFVLLACNNEKTKEQSYFNYLQLSENILNYKTTPKDKFDKNGLMFSDQGAWFAYSCADTTEFVGFSGPFLMTQQNGIWSSQCLSALYIENQQWAIQNSKSFNSHLEQLFTSASLQVRQRLVYLSGHTAFIQSEIKNISKEEISFQYQWKNYPVLADDLNFSASENQVIINSEKTNAIGYLQFPSQIKSCAPNSYETIPETIKLAEGKSTTLLLSQTFLFPEYSWKKENLHIKKTNFDSLFTIRQAEKETQLTAIINNRKNQFQDSIYAQVLIKAQLTLQNNWRIPSGEIAYEGLFPSYHYEWFNGFWSWDSWKHSVGLSYYDTDLAKKQIKLMFEFQEEDGFVADVVYRDTTIEAHNYRDTKPPLSAWAVTKVFEKDKDLDFLKELYPKLKKYHYWWYAKRDHDKDSICEYGSTDGSLIAAKWESGMDNAIRFDDSKILKNSEGAYSLNQESVDLNAYLYAEKLYLAQLAYTLQKTNEAEQFNQEASTLKTTIQEQFYDKNDGWFYDTSLDGKHFIKGEGSEGWTALWAKAASPQQAEAVKNRMMMPSKFFTKVPFQTMSADHPKFAPLDGYWRGPNWLDQAYFGVKGLRNYGYNIEADEATIQILNGAEGLLQKGSAIRENYHPLTGKGLHAQNFSWSAAHIIMLLMNE